MIDEDIFNKAKESILDILNNNQGWSHEQMANRLMAVAFIVATHAVEESYNKTLERMSMRRPM